MAARGPFAVLAPTRVGISASWLLCSPLPLVLPLPETPLTPALSPPNLHHPIHLDRCGARERVKHLAAPDCAPATAQRLRAARYNDARPRTSPPTRPLSPRALFFDRIPPRASAHQRYYSCSQQSLSRRPRQIFYNRGGASYGVATAAVPSLTASPAARAHR